MARFCPIFWMVLTWSAMSGLGTRPVGCDSMAWSPSRYFAPQPPRFLKQIHPPPYS